jgi:hypothetical protein
MGPCRDTAPSLWRDKVKYLLPSGGWEFPPPYDESVPYYIGRARKELSASGAKVLDWILEHTEAGLEYMQACKDEFVKMFSPLPQRDKDMCLAIVKHIEEAFAAMTEEAKAMKGLCTTVVAVFVRAEELDPSLPEDATLGDAIQVLERHGETAGISQEVLEMAVEIPPEEK